MKIIVIRSLLILGGLLLGILGEWQPWFDHDVQASIHSSVPRSHDS